jgi:hypothetical protein
MRVVGQSAVADNVTEPLPLRCQQPERVGAVTIADPVLDIFDGGATIGIDPAMRRDTRIALNPQLVPDNGLGYTPGPEQQSIGFEHDLPPAR